MKKLIYKKKNSKNRLIDKYFKQKETNLKIAIIYIQIDKLEKEANKCNL